MLRYFPILILSMTASCNAASWFVSNIAPGANNGTSWADAWWDTTDIVWGGGGVVAGDTIYIAGNAAFYFTLTVGASGTAASPITIRRARATNSVCTSAAGWNAAFDSQPIIRFVNLEGGYSNIVFNGEIPYVGMMFTNHLINADSSTFKLGTGGSGWITVLNSDICASGYSDVSTGANESRCWSSSSFSLACFSNRIAYCTLRNASTLLSTVKEDGMILEHNFMHSNLNGDTVAVHPNVWQALGCSNITMRFCTVSNWQAEGIMLGFTSVDDPVNRHWYIYGNVWRDSIGGSPRVLETQFNVTGPIHFFNNTVLANPLGIRISGANGGTWTADSSSSNNIAFQCPSINFGNANSDYNLSDSATAGANSISDAVQANVFVSATDYHIVATIGASYPRNKGANLGAAFALDFDGNARSASWDIGAYEYISGPRTTRGGFVQSGGRISR